MVPETSSEPLPPLYENWIVELLGGNIPRESRATCSNCAMWPGKTEKPGTQTYFFDSVIKCCTYIPNLQNFLVGRILSDTDPASEAGRATVETRIDEGTGVSPLGLKQPAIFSLLYNNSSRFFGRSRSLKCPHYLEEGGRCGVWRHRNSVCATWFCKHVRGQVGYTFWRESLLPLLQAVERALARWCVLEVGLGEAALRHLVGSADWTNEADTVTGDMLDNRLDRKAYARIWGEWLGREREFFRRCGELVSQLSWADTLAIAGPEARAFARLTQDAYRDLNSDRIPQSLEAGPFQIVQIQNATIRANPYNDYDPIDIPQELMDLLHYFDGRPTEDALATIARERGIRVDAALLRKMVDFKLLVEPEKIG